MSDQTLNNIKNRLSLRAPQTNSLSRLAHCLKLAPELLGHEQDISSILSKLQSAFPKFEDFERDFPSLCFALATGVGKTRLMGAFIAYLHIAHKINAMLSDEFLNKKWKVNLECAAQELTWEKEKPAFLSLF